MYRPFVDGLMGTVDALLGGVFQTQCSICDRVTRGAAVCRACRPARFLEGALCQRCGNALPGAMERCGQCLRRRRGTVDRARSLLWYSEDAGAILRKVKFEARFELLSVFRPAFDERFRFDGSDELSVLPVPLDSAKFAARGFNQAEALARWVAERLQREPLPSPSFVKVQSTPAQSTLPRREREKNLAKCFRWVGPALPPPRVLLVDDVYTTGTTVEACGRALRAAGVKQVMAWTLFRTPEPSDSAGASEL